LTTIEPITQNLSASFTTVDLFFPSEVLEGSAVNVSDEGSGLENMNSSNGAVDEGQAAATPAGSRGSQCGILFWLLYISCLTSFLFEA